MSKLKVFDTNGSAAGDMEIADSLLVLDRGERAVHDVVVAHLAGRRAGTASTLSKGEVAGSGQKPWRQKGTGRARAGYRQSPVWRGGAVAFGPHPRDFRQKVNRKVARLAFRRALSDKIVAGAVRVVEAIALPEAKTKRFAALLESLEIRGPALFVTDGADPGAALAARNIPNVELVDARNVHAYQLLRYPAVVVTRGAMAVLEARLGGQGRMSAA